VKVAIKEKLLGLIVGLLFSVLLFLVVYSKNEIFAYISCVILFFGVLIGFNQVWLVTSVEVAKNGFRWEFYVPSLVNIALLYWAQWPLVWLIHLIILTVLVLKNIHGLYLVSERQIT